MQVVNFLKYVNNNFAIVVGPPLWWGLLCTCTLCTLGNPALHRMLGYIHGVIKTKS